MSRPPHVPAMDRPTEGRSGASWLYTAPCDMFWWSPVRSDIEHRYHDSSGRVIFRISSRGLLTVHAGYTWNGASCWPDHPRLWRATMFHDALCQAMQCRCCPCDWPTAADVFGAIAREDGYKLAGLVRWGVRWLGGLLDVAGVPDDAPPFECDCNLRRMARLK